MMAAAGAGEEKTYVEDVFSTYLYPGNDSNIAVNNGIDISTEGGLVWIKNRDTAGYGHFLFDTERGTTKAIGANLNNAEFTEAKGVHTFSTNGFTIGGSGGDAAFNSDGVSYASWTFRKAPGFFDVVTWSGDGNANRQISHSLDCVPGAIFAKRLNVSENWLCYHKGMGNEKYIHLNLDNAKGDAQYWYDSDPTSTYFTVNDAQQINGAGYTYVAYLFAGGESTAATARSVDFDGNGDDLRWASSADFAMGTGDFTFECWLKPSNWSGTYMTVFCVGSGSNTGGLWIGKNQSNFVVRAYSVADYIQTTDFPPLGQWTHVAATRSGTTLKLFYNGIEQKSVTNSYDFQGGDDIWISNDAYDNRFVGKISNLRLVKGTAVYTSTFKRPTEPLTNITNTKVLCCNNSSVTGSTVTPGTITANGDPTASTDSPFDDSAAFTFGENEDQGIIKCGSYTGEASHSSPVEINLGFEPQWVIIKNADSTKDWVLLDTMRGWRGLSSSNGYWVEPNTTDAESIGSMARVTPTGFICQSSSFVNGSSNNFIYIAIRRPDGYVGKPADAGTDVFAIDQWVSDSTPNNEANMISNFVVDWVFDKDPTTGSGGWLADWYARSRLIQNQLVVPNTDAAIVTGTWGQFDYNNGWMNRQSLSGYTDWHSWMWKRHSGFDVGIYDGDGVNGRHIFHSMNTVPEFMIVKRLSATEDWTVYHTGLTSVNYLLTMNSSGAEVDLGSTPEKVWKSVPTASTFEIGSHDRVNTANETYLFLLFSSITGISKTGTYTGNGNSSGPTVTLGFAPRLIIVKEIDGSGAWIINDSYRGIGSGSGLLELNNSAAQAAGTLFSADSTSFTVVSTFAEVNESGKKYLYYCHA